MSISVWLLLHFMLKILMQITFSGDFPSQDSYSQIDCTSKYSATPVNSCTRGQTIPQIKPGKSPPVFEGDHPSTSLVKATQALQKDAERIGDTRNYTTICRNTQQQTAAANPTESSERIGRFSPP